MNNSFFDNKEIKLLGLSSVGTNVKISRYAKFYSPELVKIGDNVRIDDFCIISGKVEISNYVHVAAYSALYGGSRGIIIDDFVNISSRVSVYAKSDDYSGNSLPGPLVPRHVSKSINMPVKLKKHTIIGSGSVVLPGVCISEGTAIGALSLVKYDTKPWSVYAGIPIKKIRDRSKSLIDYEKEIS